MSSVCKGTTAILSILDKVEEIAQGIPPVDNKASRFGNPAFKTFYDKVTEVCTLLCPTERVTDSL